MTPINKNKIRTTAIGLLAALCTCILPGCIEDDLSECGVGIRFRYVKNVEGVDKFPSDVDRISLYVFREDGIFIGEYHDGGSRLDGNYTMNLGLKEGNYKLVAWGNLCDDYEVTPCVPGQTRLEDFMLKLKNTRDTVYAHPGHLFYGGVEEVEIKTPYTGRKYVTMDLTKNTNTIHVITSGLPLGENTSGNGDAGTPYTCRIISRNGEYNHDNSITGNRLHYIPDGTVEGGLFLSDYVVMRELNDASITGPRLVITHHPVDGGSKVLLDTSLTELLLRVSITGDLDIDDEFTLHVEFDYTNGSMTILINDYEVVGGGAIIG